MIDNTAATYPGTRLASLDESGKRPDSRIGAATNARSLVGRLKHEDDTRMLRHTLIMGLLDGNPPWSRKKLEDLGQAHRANFNLREGEGMVDAAKTPYYDLVFEVPQFAQIVFDVPGADPYRVSEWNRMIAEEYHDTLAMWRGFDQNIQLHQYQFVVNGVGPLFWPHSISWQSKAVKARKVLVPQETPANVDELEILVVLHSWRADQLEQYISGGADDNADYDGWNVPVARQAIINAALQEMRSAYGTENYDLYQRAIRCGDLFHGINRSDNIYLASLFIREFGGKVSHYIITDTPIEKNTPGKLPEINGDENGYVYKKRNKYDDFSQVICPFFFDTGPDGTWHSVKGLGPKIYDFCDVSNRTFCQMLDGAVIGSGVTLEAQDANSLEETQVALVGGATVVSAGYKVVQTRIAEALNGAMVMRRELQNTMQSNTGSYRQRVAEDNQEPTLGQAQMNWQSQATLGKGANNRYYNGGLDPFHAETLRRLLDPAAQNSKVPGHKEAKLFIERCLVRGIPPDLLAYKYIRSVTATRSVGYGSPQLRDMATKELVGMAPMMSETGRNHALRARAAALPGIGQAQVDTYFPPIEKAGIPDGNTALATLENNALRTIGGQAQVEPNQNHSIHFDTHAKDLQAHDQDPNAHITEKSVHFEQGGAHMAQHLQLLEGDPTRKNEVDQKKKQLDDIAKRTDQLHQQSDEFAQGQIKALPPPPQMSPEGQAAIEKVKGDIVLKAHKQTADIALKGQKQAATIALADKKTAADISRANIQAANQPKPAAAGR